MASASQSFQDFLADMLLELVEHGLLTRPREAGEMAAELQSLVEGCHDETQLEVVLRHLA